MNSHPTSTSTLNSPRKLANGHIGPPRSQPSKTRAEEIYAPASIASPRELATLRKTRQPSQFESQHYAAVSCPRGPGSIAASESGWSSRSARDSAIGRLIDRVGGSLRRRRNKAASLAQPGPPSLSLIPPVPRAPPTPSQLDPALYASGRRRLEAEEIYAEGLRAIDGNGQRRLLEHELDREIMREGETKTLVSEQSRNEPDFIRLVSLLIGWINDELAQQRIVVRDLQDDLYDGQILSKLVEKLHNVKLDLVEVTQNEIVQRRKLSKVLDYINRILAIQARWARIRWTAEGIHGKNIVEIIHLLITLALYYRAPIKLPTDVTVSVVVVQMVHGQLVERSHQVQLTGQIVSNSPSGSSNLLQSRRDVFDNLLEFAPGKLEFVKQSLNRFVNRHLSKVNLSCLSLCAASTFRDTQLNPDQFSDGLLLVFLIASLEDYFVPLGNLFTATNLPINQPKLARSEISRASYVETDINNNIYDDTDTETVYLQTAIEPTSYINTLPIHKLHNVNFALQLIEEAGVDGIRQQVRAEDIVNGDLKSLLRVLYALFSRYKHL